MSTAEMIATMNAARILIDARLDAIDRALLGRVSRAERLDVVGEVESRIDELLRERCGPGADPSREDVLAVLARLDPPEAYLGDQDESSPTPRERASARPTSGPVSSPAAGVSERRSWLSGISGIVAISASVLGLVALTISISIGSVALFVGGVGGGAVTSIAAGATAIVLAVKGEFRTGWAIAGLTLGVVSIIMALLFTAVLAGELL
jgi:hypothetical protein